MACPLCGDECRCSYAPATSPAADAISFPSVSRRPRAQRAAVLVNPEAYDCSEQQFAASLSAPAEVEQNDAPEPAQDENEPWTLVSASAAQKLARARATRPAPVTATSAEQWREEVASKLEKYRKRRGRPEPSMGLDFDAPPPPPTFRYSRPAEALPGPGPSFQAAELGSEPAENAPQTAAPFTPSEEARAELKTRQPEHVPSQQEDGEDGSLAAAVELLRELGEPEAIAHLQAALDIVPDDDFVFGDEPEPAKIIEFPRQPVTPPSSEELAEPMLDFPRILEAPEAVETETPLADITLNEQADEAIGALLFDLPLQPAAMEQRVFAGLIDALLVLLSGGIFVLIAAQLSARIPDGKLGIALLAALPCLLWAIYEYLFLVYAGSTPGMRLAHIGLATFEGEAVPRNLRRWRAVAMVLAGCSLGLGLFWALLDEDTLCWHDRITKTFPVSAPPQV